MSGSISGGKTKQHGISSGAQSGTSSGTTSGTNNNTFGGTSSGQQRAVAPEGWESFLNSIQPGGDGLNDTQQGASNWTQGQIGTDAGGQRQAEQYFNNQTDRGSHTLQLLAQQYPELYGEQPNVSAGQVGAVADVNAGQGSQYMDAYKNPYESQVVQGALGDLRQNYDETQNAGNMQQAAAGAFGGGRHALRENANTDDYLRNVGNLSGGLRSQGFNTAAGLGQTDASRNLQGQGMNQSTGLQRNIAQAGYDTQASSANANLLNNRQQFDVNAAYRGDELRDAAARDQATYAGNQFAIDQGLNNTSFGQGTQGFGQNMDWLEAGRALFGQDNTGTQSGTSSGTSSGTTSGTTNNILSGTSSGGGSSKGGGLGVG